MSFLPSTFVTRPSYLVCRPYSWTNRRQMLSIESEPFATKGEAESLLPNVTVPKGRKPAFLALLKQTPVLSQYPNHSDDKRWATVSWSKRAPKRLRFESRFFGSVEEAEQWGDYCADLEENKGRELYTLEILADHYRVVFP